jgi:hypothetical protein
MQGSEKIQGARCIAHTKAVWIFSLTRQIAVFQRAAIPHWWQKEVPPSLKFNAQRDLAHASLRL